MITDAATALRVLRAHGVGGGMVIHPEYAIAWANYLENDTTPAQRLARDVSAWNPSHGSYIRHLTKGQR